MKAILAFAIFLVVGISSALDCECSPIILDIAGNGFNLNVQTLGSDFALARYNTDGSLDGTFGGDGVVTTDFFGEFAQISDIEIQADGKIVAVGTATSSDDFSTQDFAIARYNSDGTPDGAFDSDGEVTTDFFGFLDRATDMKIQSDGKIVVVGFAADATSNNFTLVRYNTDGSVDSMFGSGGIVFTEFGDSDEAEEVGLMPDGRIVAIGSTTLNLNSDVAIARYNPDGTSDNTFGIGGKVTRDFFGGTDGGNALAILPDGKIVVGVQPTLALDSTLPFHNITRMVALISNSGMEAD